MALFLINLVIFGVIGVISMLLKATNRSIDHSHGYIVASSLVESYLLENRYSLTTHEDGVLTYGKTDYFYEISVKKVSDNNFYGEGLYEVSAVVSWDAHKENSMEEQHLKVPISTVVWGAAKKAGEL